MPPQRARSPARLLAPAALVVFALALIVIVLTAGGGDDGGAGGAGADSSTSAGQTETARSPATKRKRARGSAYTVKPGDTLGSIAEKTGVEVERLQELNPELDPQALVAGQKIKLRE